MFKAVIFDLDGVLLDSERLNVRYKSSLAKQLGYNITKKQFQKSLIVPLEELVGKTPLVELQNIEKKLNDFFASQVYGKYLKKEGIIEIT